MRDLLTGTTDKLLLSTKRRRQVEKEKNANLKTEEGAKRGKIALYGTQEKVVNISVKRVNVHHCHIVNIGILLEYVLSSRTIKSVRMGIGVSTVIRQKIINGIF